MELLDIVDENGEPTGEVRDREEIHSKGLLHRTSHLWIVRDNDKQLRFYIKLAEDNRVEVYRLKGIVATLLNNSCLDGTCGKRKYYTEEDIRHILGGELPEKQEEDETKS